MNHSRYEKASQGVEFVFSNPIDIKTAEDLTRDQKIALLKQWEQDLRQLITASNEGMTGRHPGKAAALLKQVIEILDQI